MATCGTIYTTALNGTCMLLQLSFPHLLHLRVVLGGDNVTLFTLMEPLSYCASLAAVSTDTAISTAL